LDTFIPASSPLPLPAPAGLFWILLVVTFWFHFLSVQLLLGTLIITITEIFTGKPREQFFEGLRRLPVIMAFVINLGIPPLLFLQLLYAQFFYTSSVIMGIPWISTIFLLIICYGCLYLARYEKKEGRVPIWLLISLVAGLMIGYFFTNNVTWMLHPDTWQQAYRTDPMGAHLYPETGGVLFRWLWAIGPAVTVTAAWLHKGRGWGWVTVALGGLAGWLFQQNLGTQADAAGTLFIVDYILLGVLVILLAAIRSPGLFYRLIGIWSLVKLVVMVAIRDTVRQHALAPYYSYGNAPVQTDWSVVIAFFLVFFTGLYTMFWMYRRGKEGLVL
jgi:hypothetical protein